MRPCILLLLCAGCDVVFLEDQPVQSRICGPYADPTPVVFDPSIPPVSHFSVVGDRALARERELPNRLVALVFDGAMWIRDPQRQANLDQLRTNSFVHYVHLASDATMFAAVLNSNRYRVSEYTFRTNMWSAEPQIVANESSANVFPGGALTTGIEDPLNTYRYVVTAQMHDMDGPSIGVAVKPPMFDSWQTEVSGGLPTTSAINEKHDASGGALAIGANERPTLIYAATRPGMTTGSDLYVSERISGRFQLGVPLVLGDDDGEELEPSTNEKCTVLYFRRGDQILEARAR